jgi:hypothetical protein
MPKSFSRNQRCSATRESAAERRARRSRRSIGIAENALAQRQPVALRALRLVAVHELGEIELERVAVARRVRALHLAQLALEAGVHHRARLARVELAHVAVVALVDEAEQRRERVAVLEAHATAVADFEHARDLAREPRLVPVLRLDRVVRQSRRGSVGHRRVRVLHRRHWNRT